jgi:hypothetical protein
MDSPEHTMYIPEKLTVGLILLLVSSGCVNSSNRAHISISKAEQFIGFGKISGDGGIPAFEVK